MKSLCYVLAVYVVFSAADNILGASNASDVSNVESRKIKHTISRIYSVPHNTARQSANINGESYKKLIDILTNKVSKQEEVETAESSTEYINVNDVDTEKLLYLYNDVSSPTPSKLAEVYSRDKNSDVTEDFDALNTTKSQFYSYVLNENRKKETGVDSDGVSTKETELNADALSDIIRNLKGSNVSNLGSKKNKIRKGKLVIYYDENDEPSGNPIEISTNAPEINRINKIEEEIFNLYVQYDVPYIIYQTIKSRTYIDEEERIRDLIIGLIKYIIYKGDLKLETINKIKLLIAENHIDIDLINLLKAPRNKLDFIDNLETQTVNAAKDVVESILDTSNDVTENGNNGESATVLNVPIVNDIDQLLRNESVKHKIYSPNIIKMVNNLRNNAKNSISPSINPNKDKIRDIIFHYLKDKDGKMTNENIIEVLPSGAKYHLFKPKGSDVKSNNNKIASTIPKLNENIFEEITSEVNKPEDVIESLLEENNHNIENEYYVAKSNYDALSNILKNVDKPDTILNNSSRTPYILYRLMEQLKHNNNIRIPQFVPYCDENEPCDLKNINKVYPFDFYTLKKLLNGALRDVIPPTQRVDPSVPVFSNIPLDEYLNYNKGKPFFIYVVFPELGEKNIEEKDQNNIINLIKDRIPQKPTYKGNEPNERDPNSLVKELEQLFPDINILNIIFDIIKNPKNPIQKNPQYNIDYPEVVDFDNDLIIDEILNNLPSSHNNLDILKKPSRGKNNPEDAASPIMDEIINLLLNTNTDVTPKFPEPNSAVENHENDILDKIKELLLLHSNKHNIILPKHKPEANALRSLIKDPDSFKTLLKLINTDYINRDAANIAEENVDQFTDDLIKRVFYIHKILELKNIAQNKIRQVIERETQKGILRITRQGLTSCATNVNRGIESGVRKALKKYMHE